MEVCGDCACPDECEHEGACYWRRYLASLSADERAVMDDYEAITAPEQADEERLYPAPGGRPAGA